MIKIQMILQEACATCKGNGAWPTHVMQMYRFLKWDKIENHDAVCDHESPVVSAADICTFNLRFLNSVLRHCDVCGIPCFPCVDCSGTGRVERSSEPHVDSPTFIRPMSHK